MSSWPGVTRPVLLRCPADANTDLIEKRWRELTDDALAIRK